MKQLALLLIFIPTILQAQLNTERENLIGFKSGIVRSDLRSSPYETKGHTGQTVGLIYTHSFSKKLGMQVELNYTRKGFSQLSALYFPNASYFRVTGGTYNTENKYNYIDLPVLLNLDLVSKKVVFGLQAGPGINFFMSGKSYTYYIPTGERGIHTVTTQFLNISLAGGAYFGLKLDRVKLLLSPRYSTNLLNSPFGSFKYPEVSFIIGYEF